LMKKIAAGGDVGHTQQGLRDLAAQWLEPSRIPKKFRIITDTSEFIRIEYDDIVVLDNSPFLIQHNQKEGRFGMDDQPKFWVKSAIDLSDGSKKIIKLVFHERFQASIGDLSFDCVRSALKEARILDLVREHVSFMHGYPVQDTASNIVRVIDFIPGQTMADYASAEGINHEEYFTTSFPAILKEYIEVVQAILFLHRQNEIHGDIRRDHLLRDNTADRLRWIDFDFAHGPNENKFVHDLFGLGNILMYIAAGRDITMQVLQTEMPHIYPAITEDDLNIIFHNRIANLRKVFPYIPEVLNRIFLHFSMGTRGYYDNTEELLDDLIRAADAVQGA
jgi:serine/threonine protein kinase